MWLQMASPFLGHGDWAAVMLAVCSSVTSAYGQSAEPLSCLSGCSRCWGWSERQQEEQTRGGECSHRPGCPRLPRERALLWLCLGTCYCPHSCIQQLTSSCPRPGEHLFCHCSHLFYWFLSVQNYARPHLTMTPFPSNLSQRPDLPIPSAACIYSEGGNPELKSSVSPIKLYSEWASIWRALSSQCLCLSSLSSTSEGWRCWSALHG